MKINELKKNKAKKHSSDNIRGSIESFVSFNEARLSGIRTMDDAAYFRNISKDTIALRMKETLFVRQLISRDSVKIINNAFGNKYFFHCVQCMVDYYNLSSNDPTHLATINTSLSTYKSRDRDESVQHAKMDCIKCADTIIKVNSDWKKHNGCEEVWSKLNDLSLAIKFFANYISFLLTKKNSPKSLTKEVYESLLNQDSSFSDLYLFNPNNKTYKLVKKNLSKSTQETLTILFCSKYLAIH